VGIEEFVEGQAASLDIAETEIEAVVEIAFVELVAGIEVASTM
jgi:hypothetical protein